MDEHSQIVIPEAFVDLYRPTPHGRPTLGRVEIAARHELCEDLAQAMTEHARTMLFGAGLAEDEVLRRCHHGLRAPGAGLSAAEATWVVRRLAELLDWPQPGLPPGE
jgi:hypothetical protein